MNKRAKVAVAVLALISSVSFSVFAEYDRDHVVSVMRGNVSLISEIGAAAGAGNWILAAQKLFAISDDMVGIMKYDPPRGSKADWVATIEEFVFTAYLGIGACGEKDGEALLKSIAKLRMLNGQGHSAHK